MNSLPCILSQLTKLIHQLSQQQQQQQQQQLLIHNYYYFWLQTTDKPVSTHTPANSQKQLLQQ